MRLIVINYSMSSKNPIFSHQKEVVLALSEFFETINVFTTDSGSEPLPKNVELFHIPWELSSPARNFFTILKTLYPVLIRNRSSVVFTHMTDIHAAIISPLTWLLGVRHVLWYAHASNSKYLIWSSFFVSGIISSTPGSCNLRLNQKKISYIDQGISESIFPYRRRSDRPLRKILYYGRLDPSKNIHLFPSLVSKLNSLEKSYTLNLFGRPTNSSSEKYIMDIVSSLRLQAQDYAIFLNDPIERVLISVIAQEYDIFLNMFSGSLDKTLIEATFMGLPVVTWNREYCSQFGTWSGCSVDESLDFIVTEFETINKLEKSELQTEVERRLKLAIRNHSFTGWIDRLVGVLKEGII